MENAVNFLGSADSEQFWRKVTFFGVAVVGISSTSVISFIGFYTAALAVPDVAGQMITTAAMCFNILLISLGTTLTYGIIWLFIWASAGKSNNKEKCLDLANGRALLIFSFVIVTFFGGWLSMLHFDLDNSEIIEHMACMSAKHALMMNPEYQLSENFEKLNCFPKM